VPASKTAPVAADTKCLRVADNSVVIDLHSFGKENPVTDEAVAARAMVRKDERATMVHSYLFDNHFCWIRGVLSSFFV